MDTAAPFIALGCNLILAWLLVTQVRRNRRLHEDLALARELRLRQQRPYTEPEPRWDRATQFASLDLDTSYSADSSWDSKD